LYGSFSKADASLTVEISLRDFGAFGDMIYVGGTQPGAS
jgi:hypothetical protein